MDHKRETTFAVVFYFIPIIKIRPFEQNKLSVKRFKFIEHRTWNCHHTVVNNDSGIKRLRFFIRNVYLAPSGVISSPSLYHVTGYFWGFFTLHDSVAVSFSTCRIFSRAFWIWTSAVKSQATNFTLLTSLNKLKHLA